MPSELELDRQERDDELGVIDVYIHREHGYERRYALEEGEWLDEMEEDE